ncbi:MAG: hypothetical protein AAGG45_03475 [Pseudomonadota bacterium]
MVRLGQVLFFLFILALASVVFAIASGSMIWIFDASSRGAFVQHVLVPAFVTALMLAWLPSWMAYRRIDHPEHSISTMSALVSYAKWGSLSALSIPLIIYSVLWPFFGGAIYFEFEILVAFLMTCLWFSIAGAIAGVVFGTLVPIGLPSGRDDSPTAR